MKKNLFLFFLAALFSLIFHSCQHEEDLTTASKLEDLNGKTVAVITGSTQDLSVTKAAPNATVLRLSSPAELLLAVESNRADYCVIDEASIVTVDLKQRGLHKCFPLAEEWDICMAFNKEKGVDLCRQYNEFLSELKETGELDAIFHRWFTTRIDTVIMPNIDLPKKGKVIKVGTLGGDMPLSFIKNNKWAGLEVEILERFGQHIGRPVVFQDYEFSGMIAAVSTDKIDIITACIAKTEERAKKVLFSDPYYHCGSFCLSHVETTDGKGSNASFFTKISDNFKKNFIEEDRWKLIFKGLKETIVIAFCALIFGTIIGAGLCFLRMSKRKFWRNFAKVYIEIMRGVPILVFLMVMFYVVFSSSGVSATWVAIFAFSLNLAAYVCETFRTGIESIDKGQTEAGRALGFGKVKCFFLIIVPQAIKSIMPVYKGDAVTLIKNTSIVGYIAIQDLTKISDIIRSRTFDAFYPLILVSLVYLFLAWLLGFILDRIAKKI